MKYIFLALLPLVCCATAAPREKLLQTQTIKGVVTPHQIDQEKDDLKTDASSYSHQYSDWGGKSPGGYEYSVTGFGVIDDKYDSSYGGFGRYDNSYNNVGYPENADNSGYLSNPSYGGDQGYGRYSPSGLEGNGGYGGYGGNGGLSSYYGYNNPYYHGSNHLGYGYYNKRPGYGNIYNGGITPSLITGYRGYTR
ncbi:unnamed protein product [Parnassius mnemosyne]|uniref:Prisilkin-39 n=1 Tax=Parnassius mnemosyne TaxID=213953 RepID=A0AAV1M945_9NEOP